MYLMSYYKMLRATLTLFNVILSFDYGDKFWIIKCKAFTCTCGAESCRYSDKTIQITLENYRKRIHREDLHQQTSSTSKT